MTLRLHSALQLLDVVHADDFEQIDYRGLTKTASVEDAYELAVLEFIKSAKPSLDKLAKAVILEELSQVRWNVKSANFLPASAPVGLEPMAPHESAQPSAQAAPAGYELDEDGEPVSQRFGNSTVGQLAGMAPVAGVAINGTLALQELGDAITGKDEFGRDMSWGDRAKSLGSAAINGVYAVPGIGAGAKVVGKGAKLAWKGIKALSNTRVGKALSRFSPSGMMKGLKGAFTRIRLGARSVANSKPLAWMNKETLSRPGAQGKWWNPKRSTMLAMALPAVGGLATSAYEAFSGGKKPADGNPAQEAHERATQNFTQGIDYSKGGGIHGAQASPFSQPATGGGGGYGGIRAGTSFQSSTPYTSNTDRYGTNQSQYLTGAQ